MKTVQSSLVSALVGLVAPASLLAQMAIAVPRNGVIDISVTRERVEVHGWDRNELVLEGNTAHEALRTASGAQVRRIRGRTSNEPLRINVPRSVSIVLDGSSNDVDVRNIEGDVEVRVNNGDVTMSHIGGRVRVASIFGDINVADVRKGTRIVTAGGDVTMSDLQGSAEVTTTGGNISLTRSTAGNVALETINGDVRFSGTLAEGSRNTISTHSGSVHLEFTSDARATIEMSSFMGELRSQKSLVMMPDSDRSGRESAYRLQLGVGGPTVVVTTFSGNIDITRIDAPSN